MNIKALEAKAIQFEKRVLKIAKDSALLSKIAKLQEEAKIAYEKSRSLYQEYLNSD